ncbi:MAG: hypothetical protein IT373_27895 [Polyangiaceae bacterium]|nr:hypothetical protein [Polyangiaceae bacterium]
MSDDLDTLDPDVYEKAVLPLDPEGAVAIKRGIHCIDVAAPAADVMRAFTAVLEDPGRRFGLIELLRTPDRVGRPYSVGERFQGRYIIEKAVEEELAKLPLPGLMSSLSRAFAALSPDPLLELVEDRMLSDYGVITDLVTSPASGQPYRLRYEYLDGTPIAGFLSIECLATGPATCRFTQLSEYQEQGIEILLVYGTAVLKMHERVFYEMVKQSADRIGAAILGTDIPEAYYRPV